MNPDLIGGEESFLGLAQGFLRLYLCDCSTMLPPSQARYDKLKPELADF